MSYPDRPAYTTAVKNAGKLIIDPVLKSASPRLGKDGFPQMISGGVAVVYVFQDAGKIFAVKCWVSDIGDLRDHYQRVHGFLRTAQSEYFVEFAFVENGIIANGRKWPLLRMEWVGGKSLQEFVRDNAVDKAALELLAARYLRMTERLHVLQVAHGDLQGSNIKVVGNGPGIDFRLIDYDTLIVRSSRGSAANALALPSYQHPRRGQSSFYTGKEDYFSELVIYVSLLAVAEQPSLWNKYPSLDRNLVEDMRHDKEMLFVKEDFAAERPTDVFKELVKLSPLVRALTLILWNYTRTSSIEELIPLENAVKLARESLNIAPEVQLKSGFEVLLGATLSSASNWLDDSAFKQKPQASRGASTKVHVQRSLSFEELVRGNTPSKASRIEAMPNKGQGSATPLSPIKSSTASNRSAQNTASPSDGSIVLAMLGGLLVIVLFIANLSGGSPPSGANRPNTAIQSAYTPPPAPPASLVSHTPSLPALKVVELPSSKPLFVPPSASVGAALPIAMPTTIEPAREVAGTGNPVVSELSRPSAGPIQQAAEASPSQSKANERPASLGLAPPSMARSSSDPFLVARTSWSPNSTFRRVKVINVGRGDTLSLRSLPNSKSKKVADIPANATGIELLKGVESVPPDKWFPVVWQGIEGWVNGSFVDYY